MKQKTLNFLYQILAILILLIIWQLIVSFFNISPSILPSPIVIINRFFKVNELIMFHAKQTITTTFISLFLAIVVGIFIASLMDNFSLFEHLAFPILIFIQTIPTIAIGVLFIIWFGFDQFGKIILVFLTASFPIITNSLSGFKNIDKDYLEMFQLMEANKLQIYWQLKLPFALPYILAGIKISTTYVLLTAIFAEYLGARKGLGIYLSRAQTSSDNITLFVIVVFSSLITLLMMFLIAIIEKLTLQKRRAL